MRVTYAVTFEFVNRPPLTHRGETSGTTVSALVARATREAHRALRPKWWSSMNCVLLERLDAEAEASEKVSETNGDASSDDQEEEPAT